MDDHVIHAEHIFGQKDGKNLTSAYRAVEYQTPYDALMNHFLSFKYAVREMRIMQKKRERDLEISTWDMAATMERQVDTMLWSPL